MASEPFRAWYCHNEAAILFMGSVWEAMQAWDDIIDEGTSPQSAALMDWLLVGRDADPFYSAHRAILWPAMLQMLLNWKAANVLERQSAAGVEKALVLRAGYYQLAHMVSYICGGLAHAEKVGPDIWGTYGETVASLKKEFGHA